MLCWRDLEVLFTPEPIAEDVELERPITSGTVGEITVAMEKVFGRHSLSTKTITGVYGKSVESSEKMNSINQHIDSKRRGFNFGLSIKNVLMAARSTHDQRQTHCAGPCSTSKVGYPLIC